MLYLWNNLQPNYHLPYSTRTRSVPRLFGPRTVQPADLTDPTLKDMSAEHHYCSGDALVDKTRLTVEQTTRRPPAPDTTQVADGTLLPFGADPVS